MQQTTGSTILSAILLGVITFVVSLWMGGDPPRPKRVPHYASALLDDKFLMRANGVRVENVKSTTLDVVLHEVRMDDGAEGLVVRRTRYRCVREGDRLFGMPKDIVPGGYSLAFSIAGDKKGAWLAASSTDISAVRQVYLEYVDPADPTTHGDIVDERHK